MMNIKSAWFYAALAACLGTGYGGGVVVSQRDIDMARVEGAARVQCEDTVAEQRFRSTRPMNSAGQGF